LKTTRWGGPERDDLSSDIRKPRVQVHILTEEGGDQGYESPFSEERACPRTIARGETNHKRLQSALKGGAPFLKILCSAPKTFSLGEERKTVIDSESKQCSTNRGRDGPILAMM